MLKCNTPQATMIKEPNTQTNTHPTLAEFLHFLNVGSFDGLLNVINFLLLSYGYKMSLMSMASFVIILWGAFNTRT
jgi:phenylalanyl-tRNA synthetase beta subunit